MAERRRKPGLAGRRKIGRVSENNAISTSTSSGPVLRTKSASTSASSGWLAALDSGGAFIGIVRGHGAPIPQFAHEVALRASVGACVGHRDAPAPPRAKMVAQARPMRPEPTIVTFTCPAHVHVTARAICGAIQQWAGRRSDMDDPDRVRATVCRKAPEGHVEMPMVDDHDRDSPDADGRRFWKRVSTTAGARPLETVCREARMRTSPDSARHRQHSLRRSPPDR